MRQRVRHSVFRFVVPACVVAFVTASAAAADTAPTKEQCISANESAQGLRRSGKLRDARAQLVLCVQRACPALVRDDCAERLAEVDKVLPSIAFAVKAPDGSDLTAVTVTMDGAPLASRLDANALVLDPGEHVFELSSPGYAKVTKKLIVREGEKGRVETITFAPLTSAPPPPAPAPKPTVAPSAAPPPPAPTSSTAADTHAEEPPKDEASPKTGSSRKTIAYVVGGAGIAGIGVGSVFGLVASSTYSSAKKGCTDPGAGTGCSDGAVQHGKDAHTQALISTVGFIAGGALLAGGVVLYLTAPKDGGVNVQASAGPGSAGVTVGGAW